jgi:NADPH-dependent curcumin reductase CurA
MSTPQRPLTNDYNDCRLIKLDAADPKSPLVLMQEAYAPKDPACRMRMFYLQRNGQWIDEVARSTRPDGEIGDIVFETAAEAVQVLSGLTGSPLIRAMPVTEADMQAYLARVKSAGSAEQAIHSFLARYRSAKGHE